MTSSNIPSYETGKQLEVGIGGKISVEIFKAFPSLKAEATATGGISMKIKSGGLSLKKIDESAFEKAIRGR